jgi:phosphoribosyl 1,2-cyclic phosphodiesterase
MLENGRYPIHLKNRIRGGQGHLSNKEALDLFITHRSPALSYLLLSHLSKENNSPEMVEALFNEYTNGTNIIVASRYQATEVFTITANTVNPKQGEIYKPVQLGLF